MEILSSFIDGVFISSTEEELEVYDKYSNEVIGTVALASKKDVESALEVVVSAFQSFKLTSRLQRVELLDKLVEVLEEGYEDFIKIIIQEAGKPVSYARAEIDRCIVTTKIGIEYLQEEKVEEVDIDYGAGKGRTAFTKRFPKGPVVGIAPFNFPLNLALHKIVPALASGCSVIIKPSPYTPISILELTRRLYAKGFPNGVLNVIVTNNENAELLVSDNRPQVFSFTGSDSIGWMLKSKAGKKTVVMELGGNAPVIIDSNNQDLKVVAKQVAIGAFLYAGQICISTQRIILHTDIYESFKAGLIEAIDELKCGNPGDETTMVGPLISGDHVERIIAWLNDAIEKGAVPLVQGSRVSENVLSPSLLENVGDCSLRYDEVFGPVAILDCFDNYEGAIALANDSRYGLQVGVYTESDEFFDLCMDHLDYGSVIRDSVPGFRVDGMPYGGIKDSGLGKEGVKYAIEDYTYEKLIVSSIEVE